MLMIFAKAGSLCQLAPSTRFWYMNGLTSSLKSRQTRLTAGSVEGDASSNCHFAVRQVRVMRRVTPAYLVKHQRENIGVEVIE